MGVFFISEMGGNDIFSKAVWGGYFFEQSKSRDPAHVMINLGSHTPSQCIHQIISNAPATPDTQKNSHPKLLRHTIEKAWCSGESDSVFAIYTLLRVKGYPGRYVASCTWGTGSPIMILSAYI